MKRPAAAAGASVIGSAAAYVLVVRPWQLRWGGTDQERDATLAGDDLIANPDLTATRAITVHAVPAQVWPWIAQLGQGRGGFYSYDALENLVGCDIHSADQIVPEWQDIKVGDQVKLHPEFGLDVIVVEPGQALVLRGGVPVGAVPPPTIAPGPLSCGSSRRGRPGCWSASATSTPSGGRRSWSSRLRWSPS
jgi:hypothetical protein